MDSRECLDAPAPGRIAVFDSKGEGGYFRDIERAKIEAEMTRRADRRTALIAGMAGAAVSAVFNGLLSIAARLIA